MSTEEISHEQAYVSVLYQHVDDQRATAAERLAGALRATGGTQQSRTERDADAAHYQGQLALLDAAEQGLCFGRLDLLDGTTRYIGRIGVFDDEHEPLLIDWRAPASQPFYLATALAPDGVRRRRHIHTSGRRVTGLNDEVLDLATAGPGAGLVGEAALLAALSAGRTGGMRDIVETIQAEQDRIIRAPHGGVLVVQGGPGTGKTAVALHRAAYLLYASRRELAQRGVLIVGPNPTFLHYIGDVLPGLGETSALLATVGDLFPGVTADAVDSPAAAAVKGRLAMAEVLAAAVRDRQRVPDEPIEITTTDVHPGLGYQPETLLLTPEICQAAKERANRGGRRHNLARPVFVAEVIAALARQVADRIGADPYGGGNLLEESDVAEIRQELTRDTRVRAALRELWPDLTPQRLLADLYADDDRMAAAGLAPADRDLLRRTGTRWTPADVALLDEAAEVLGVDDSAERERAERVRQERIDFARGVLQITAGSQSYEFEDESESEILHAVDLLDADRLAERHEIRVATSVAELAAADRTWTFGHVIVDEAQELSEMAWRMLMRRCPTRSMTVVGDTAQTGSAAGTTSWERVLAPYVGDRWRLVRLTVNYRTPEEIMAAVAALVPEHAADLPRSVRATGRVPWRARYRDPAGIAALVTAELPAEGTLGVITAERERDAVAEAVGERERVSVFSVAEAKGLEFDVVLVVDPVGIAAESARGDNDLYVALTRATQGLGVLYPGEAPPLLAGLAERD